MLTRIFGTSGDGEGRDATGAPTDLGLGRIHALSDGLFAISLTILVIDLRLPDLPAAAGSIAVTGAIEDLLPKVFAYVLSFTIISFYWVAHLRRFALLERANVRFAYLNMLLLAFIALIPFPTSVVGEHGDLPIAVLIYAGTLAAAGFAGFLSWVYALRAGLVKADAPHDLVRSGSVRGLAAPVVMLASLLFLPFVSTYVVELSWLLILPVQWFLGRHAIDGSS